MKDSLYVVRNTDNMINSYAVDGRIEELEGSVDEDDQAELATLRGLIEQYGGGDWEYGVVLIRESHFADYAEDLARDTVSVDANAWDSWPLNCIDWDRAADDLRIDYTEIDYDGVTYYARA